MDKVQKIREEVERIQLYTQSEVLKQVLDYIDDVQKEPVSEKLEEELEKYIKEHFTIDTEQLDRFGIEENDYMYSMDKSDMLALVEHFTNCQKEQFEKNRLAACDRQTEEEAEIEADFVMGIIEKEHRQPTFDDAIKYGMMLKEQQMMANAIDGVITNAGGTFGYDVASFKFDDNHSFQVLLPTDRKSKFGDKVKVIVIKEG